MHPSIHPSIPPSIHPTIHPSMHPIFGHMKKPCMLFLKCKSRIKLGQKMLISLSPSPWLAVAFCTPTLGRRNSPCGISPVGPWLCGTTSYHRMPAAIACLAPIGDAQLLCVWQSQPRSFLYDNPKRRPMVCAVDGIIYGLRCRCQKLMNVTLPNKLTFRRKRIHCPITMGCLYHIWRLHFQLRGSMREFFPRSAIMPKDPVFCTRPERENHT